MARATGANALMNVGFETTPGIISTSSFRRLPFVSHTMGEVRGLLTSDLLGQGRETQDPAPDVANNVGDIVIPVDARNIGFWLSLFFGASINAPSAVAGYYTHLFASGAAALPSASIEIGMPEVPMYSTHYGVRGDKLKITMARSGLLTATCSLIAIGESAPAGASIAGNPASFVMTRFAQASCYVKKDGAVLGSIVGANFTFDNNLDPVNTIQADGRIEDSDPGMVMMSGQITARFKDFVLLNAATSGTPIDLAFGWSNGNHGLFFEMPRIFLPKSKIPVAGPKGIQADFDWQASGASGHAVAVTLQNDQAGL